MKNLIRTTAIFLLIMAPYAVWAQENYYHARGEKIWMEQVNNMLLVKFAEGTDLPAAMLNVNTLNLPYSHTVKQAMHSFAVIEFTEQLEPSAQQQAMGQLAPIGNREYISRFYRLKAHPDEIVGLTDQVIVKLPKNRSKEELEKFLQGSFKGVSIVYGNRWHKNNRYVLKANPNEYNGIDLARELFETGFFEFAEPDFLMSAKKAYSPNDALLSNQWAVDNTASSTQFNGCSVSGASTSASMQVLDAWDITTGSADIKIAILDDGVDMGHPDLQNNLLAGYDATGGGSSGYRTYSGDAHGTACAGLAGADTDNNTGIAGVGFDCKIVSVRIYANGNFWSTTSSQKADGIDWAWSSAGGDADILSCSWNMTPSFSQTVEDAINDAVEYGRCGLGAIVVFAAGNTNHEGVTWPPKMPGVISVGGTTMCDDLWHSYNGSGDVFDDDCYNTSCSSSGGTSFGDELDIVAPAVALYTLDLLGTDGYNTSSSGSGGDYFANFSGTSGAAPLVAGVAGLILSVNCHLTHEQVKEILFSTADKIDPPNYNAGTLSYSTVSGHPYSTWNKYTGHGRVNAYEAVYEASTGFYPLDLDIQGEVWEFCENGTVMLSAPAWGCDYQWYKDGVPIDGAITQYYDVLYEGTYEVFITGRCGYSSWSNSITVECNFFSKETTRIETIEKPSKVQVFPNPANKTLIVSGLQNTTSLRIINATGQTVYENSSAKVIDQKNYQIDISGLSGGVYLLLVETSTGTESYRVIKL